jgi:molybdate transport system permease protein
VRADLRRELRQLQLETGISTVLVTHDPEEAALLAAEVMVIADGHLLQEGARREVFARPASPEVARLLGIANLLPGTARPGGGIVCGDVAFQGPAHGLPPGTPLWWCIRPEQVRVGAAGSLEALVVDVLDLGSAHEVALDLGGGLLLRGRGGGAGGAVPGERCRVEVPAEAIAVWPRTP